MHHVSTEEFSLWLEKFINFERWANKEILNLKNMNLYASLWEHPESAYKSIHIAGSKGKGSVSIMLSSILKEAGYKVGLYTSPHVEDFRERVSCAGIFFSDEAYSKGYRKVIDFFEKIVSDNPSIDPTWFEIVTMLAFIMFRDEECEWGVFETGMGGRLDTTNVLTPECSVICPIELEHCQYLGDTKEKIAKEKAGIIKKGRPVFCFDQDASPLSVFRDKAKEMHSSFYYLPDMIQDIKITPSLDGLALNLSFNRDYDFLSSFTRPIDCTLSFIDTVQGKNAALASVVAKYLIPSIKEDVIERGLASAWLPARFELYSRSPLVILDGAHTQKSIEYCVETYKKIIREKCILLFACADDKDTKHIAPLFSEVVEKIYITIPGTFKKSDIEKTEKDFMHCYKSTNISCIVSSNYQNIINTSYDEAKKRGVPLLVTGSFYLVAEAKKIIGNQCCKEKEN